MLLKSLCCSTNDILNRITQLFNNIFNYIAHNSRSYNYTAERDFLDIKGLI